MNNLVHSLTAELNSNFGGKMSNQILGTYTKIADERGSDSSIFPMVDILKDGDMFMTAGYELTLITMQYTTIFGLLLITLP
mgnify:CR=1 FL=1